MCGIIAGFNTKSKKKQKPEKINNFIIDQFQDQCSRGTKGFGIIRIEENGNIEVDRATEEIKFMLDLYLKPAKMIIAHHRQPTSSDNKMRQTHPILISNKLLAFDYLFVHNGIITNDKKLKEKHNKMGFNYSTQYEKEGYYAGSPTEIKFNDSEALGTEVSLFIEGKQDYIENTNTAAFITLQINKKTNKAEKVFFGRSGISSCLNLAKIKGNIKISSEGEGEEVIAETLWSFDPKTTKMKLESRAMLFKEIKEPTPEPTKTESHMHQNTLTLTSKDKPTTDTKTDAALVIIKERPWVSRKTDESVEEYNYEEEEVFIDKSYKDEMIKEFKENIKEDDTEMLESSLDVVLDDQTEKANKMITNFQKIILTRRMDPSERSFYLSQTFMILKTMEELANVAEDDYIEKLALEETKQLEDYDLEKTSMGFRAPRQTHNYHSGEMEDAPGNMDFNKFG